MGIEGSFTPCRPGFRTKDFVEVVFRDGAMMGQDIDVSTAPRSTKRAIEGVTARREQVWLYD